MMKYEKTISVNLFFLFLNSIAFSQSNLLTIDDFKMVVGCWHGTLTYLDYTTNKPFSMSASLNIRHLGDTNSFSFANSYPNEESLQKVELQELFDLSYDQFLELSKKAINGAIARGANSIELDTFIKSS